ncbi:MAG TPA: hypothetical protein VJ901_04460 [Thermoanaerobaculia bacterium]|nr:hypothetical protein [Thermoanaerobaculia bacterium]
MELHDLRGADRFVADERLAGSFGSASITVIDLAEEGAQIEHAQPLRLGLKARFWFRSRDISVSAQGLIVWSHLSKRPSADGKLLYRSGVRIEEEGDQFADTLRQLVRSGIVHRDVGALDRKRKRLEEKEQERWGKPGQLKVFRSEQIPPDQVMLIQHARERLRSHPDEALKWYNRAKYALVEDDTAIGESLRHRDDVLAVWEYLERSVPIETIASVFERKWRVLWFPPSSRA